MGTRTPWGTSDSSKKVAKGIMLYTTPSHGGFHLSLGLNAKVHEAWRKTNGWYEEDCEWAIVVLTFPQHFGPDEIEHAKVTAKAYYPHEYKAATGEDVQLEESHVLREEADAVKHADSLVVTCAFGDWHAKVPQGMVGVCAIKGSDASRRLNGTSQERGKRYPERFFLVPAGEYRDGPRCALGFIVDTARHRETEAFG